MTVPDEAVEAAARAMSPRVWGPQVWTFAALGESPTAARARVQQESLDQARAALTAAAPFIAAQATALIADLIDPEPCSFDHNHSCQAHGYFYLKQEEACPQHDAKEWVKTYRSGT